MVSDERCNQVLYYVTQEGFKLEEWADCKILLLGDKAYFSWTDENYSHYEMILSMYAALVEPPLLYN